MTNNRTMKRLNVAEVKAHLSEQLERLERGDEDVIVICRRNRPIAELRAIPARRATRRPILRRDPRFKLSKRFFEPLPAALVAGFEGEA